MKTTVFLLAVYSFGVWSARALPQRPSGHDGGQHESDRHIGSEWNRHMISMSDGSMATRTPSATTPTSMSTSQAASATLAVSGSAVLSHCAASMDGQLPSQTPSNFDFSGNVRRFYVAAEEVEWDYAPSGWDNWLGVPLSKSPRADAVGYNKYGYTWLKALYRGYTDSSFSEYSKQPPWQGTQGPTLRAEVGDMIEIMFVNKMSTYYATMHSMGLEYSKYNEGGDYANNTKAGADVVLPIADSGVPPGECVVYKWLVSSADGPPQGEPAVTHSYHSYVALQQDTNAGLVGPTIIYSPGKMQSTMAAYREFTLLYDIYMESDSWLSGVNAAKLVGQPQPASPGSSSTPIGAPGNETVWLPQQTNYGGAGKFEGAPPFHSMNGYVYANNPSFEMCEDDQVIWYVNAYGSASHVFHMHGNGFTYNGVGNYAISINDGVGKTLYMNATDVGKWQVICHVANHQTNGMELYYTVQPSGQCSLNALSSS